MIPVDQQPQAPPSPPGGPARLAGLIPIVSFAVGAAAISAPALIGQLFLSASDLGVVATAVLTAQLAVGLSRIGLILPVENSGSGLVLRWSHHAVINTAVAVLVWLAGDLRLDWLPAILAGLIAGGLETARLLRGTSSTGMGQGLVWVGVMVSAGLGVGLPSAVGANGTLAMWLLAGAVGFGWCRISHRRAGHRRFGPGRSDAPRVATAGALPWRTVAVGAADFALGSVGVYLTFWLTSDLLGIEALGRLRAGQNVLFPLALAGAATTFVCSSPRLVGDQRRALALAATVPLGATAAAGGLWLGVTAVDALAVDRWATVVLGASLLLNGLAAPLVVHLRRADATGLVVRARGTAAAVHLLLAASLVLGWGPGGIELVGVVTAQLVASIVGLLALIAAVRMRTPPAAQGSRRP
jgi:hypothetical protein